MKRIDAHVHLYTSRNLERVAKRLPNELPTPHPLEAYLEKLIEAGCKPDVINNVHLSILPDSENVFASFLEMDWLRSRNPERYDSITMVGKPTNFPTQERTS